MKLIDIYAEVTNMVKDRENYFEFKKTSENLLKKLNEAINIESANAKGGNTEKMRYKAAKDSLSKDLHRPALTGSWEEFDKQCFCNGFMGFMLTDKVEGLPTIPTNIEPLNLTAIFSDISRTPKFEIEFDIKEIKKNLDMAKALSKGPKTITSVKEGIFEIGNKYTNIQYVYNALVVLGEKVTVYSDDKSTVSPVFLSSEKGRAIVLPIRKP